MEEQQPEHRQVLIKVNAEVDEGIADLISVLNSVPGLLTLCSCQGYPDAPAFVYFMFGDWRETCDLVFEKIGPALKKNVGEDVWLSIETMEKTRPMVKLGFLPEATVQVTSILKNILIPPQVSDLYVTSVADFIKILDTVNNYTFDPEEDQYGKLRPSSHAVTYCMKILLELVKRGKLIKPSDITVDLNADIRISWVRGPNETELICPSGKGKPYIYLNSNGRNHVIKVDVSVDDIIVLVHQTMMPVDQGA